MPSSVWTQVGQGGWLWGGRGVALFGGVCVSEGLWLLVNWEVSRRASTTVYLGWGSGGSAFPHLPCWSLSLGIAGGWLLISSPLGASLVTPLGCKLDLCMVGRAPVLLAASLWLEQEVSSSLPARWAGVCRAVLGTGSPKNPSHMCLDALLGPLVSPTCHGLVMRAPPGLTTANFWHMFASTKRCGV